VAKQCVLIGTIGRYKNLTVDILLAFRLIHGVNFSKKKKKKKNIEIF
jgi:hypothetical protein